MKKLAMAAGVLLVAIAFILVTINWEPPMRVWLMYSISLVVGVSGIALIRYARVTKRNPNMATAPMSSAYPANGKDGFSKTTERLSQIGLAIVLAVDLTRLVNPNLLLRPAADWNPFNRIHLILASIAAFIYLLFLIYVVVGVPTQLIKTGTAIRHSGHLRKYLTVNLIWYGLFVASLVLSAGITNIFWGWK